MCILCLTSDKNLSNAVFDLISSVTVLLIAKADIKRKEDIPVCTGLFVSRDKSQIGISLENSGFIKDKDELLLDISNSLSTSFKLFAQVQVTRRTVHGSDYLDITFIHNKD